MKMSEVLDVPVGALLARAGRLGPDDLQRFWESPLIPSLVMSSTGWNESEAKLFKKSCLRPCFSLPLPRLRPTSQLPLMWHDIKMS